jgi:ATP-dependent helicase/nuclease subunit B
MNDGLLPETRQEDPFLPERIRLEWGLPSEKSRLCRDSYLLLCLSATRRHDNKGRLDLLLAQSDGEGTLLKPSRLLMRCADDAELPGLVSELFRELPARPVEPWKAAWALTPERKKASGILSASAIRDYLACPTRFYLKHVLKVRKESYGAVEADAATFGKLLHDTLRDFGNDPKLKSLSNPDKIAEALVHRWKELFHARYGSTLSFPLIYQREAGIRRLRAVASIQASLRSEGWEIIVCEQSFKDFTFPGIPSDMQLNGQIDRIDRRMTPSGVQWRIIDYKSSEKDKDPQKQHYRPIGKSERTIDFPACEILELNNKTSRWIDLQLPLYRMVLLSEMTLGEPKCLGLGDLMRGEVEAGYLVIPAKISDTSFTPFEGIAELEQSARECLQGVLEAIREGVFWPPRNPQYDDYQGLFFDRLNATPQSGQQTLDPVHLVAGRTS